MRRIPLHILNRYFVVFALLAVLAGCFAKAPAIRYYNLGSLATQTDPTITLDKSDISVGVGPVTLPEYLKRARIATRVAAHQYRFDPNHRWAGLLEEDLVRVISTNLGVLLGTDRVAIFPWGSYFRPDCRIVISIDQFDSAFDGDAVLRAHWSINDSAGKTLLASGQSTHRLPLEDGHYESLVTAQSDLLIAFSRELAEQIVALNLP
ncbi:MAG: PqiC family protein [Desulfuromonadales bacterium]